MSTTGCWAAELRNSEGRAHGFRAFQADTADDLLRQVASEDGRWARRVFLGDGRIVIQVFPPRMPGGHELYVLQPISAEQYESAVKASTFCRN